MQATPTRRVEVAPSYAKAPAAKQHTEDDWHACGGEFGGCWLEEQGVPDVNARRTALAASHKIAKPDRIGGAQRSQSNLDQVALRDECPSLIGTALYGAVRRVVWDRGGNHSPGPNSPLFVSVSLLKRLLLAYVPPRLKIIIPDCERRNGLLLIPWYKFSPLSQTKIVGNVHAISINRSFNNLVRLLVSSCLTQFPPWLIPLALVNVPMCYTKMHWPKRKRISGKPVVSPSEINTV